jgi:hypothetical protein
MRIRKVRLTVLTWLALIMTASVPATAQQQQTPQQIMRPFPGGEARRAAFQRCWRKAHRRDAPVARDQITTHLVFTDCMTAAGFNP